MYLHLKAITYTRIEEFKSCIQLRFCYCGALPKDKWKEPSTTIIEEESVGVNDNPDDGGDDDDNTVSEGVVSDKELPFSPGSK